MGHLDGEGLPGILTREPGGFRYHRNLSGGKLARGRGIRTEPSLGAEGAQWWIWTAAGSLRW